MTDSLHELSFDLSKYLLTNIVPIDRSSHNVESIVSMSRHYLRIDSAPLAAHENMLPDKVRPILSTKADPLNSRHGITLENLQFLLTDVVDVTVLLGRNSKPALQNVDVHTVGFEKKLPKLICPHKTSSVALFL